MFASVIDTMTLLTSEALITCVLVSLTVTEHGCERVGIREECLTPHGPRMLTGLSFFHEPASISLTTHLPSLMASILRDDLYELKL